MKHFYSLLAALVCTPLLAQKPAQMPDGIFLTPQHESEMHQHMAQQPREAKVNTAMTRAMTRAASSIYLRDYEETYDKDNKLASKVVYSYDERGNRTSIESYVFALGDGIVWEGEMTADAWYAAPFRFSDNEGYLPSLSDALYEKLVGKTMHLDIKNVARDSSSFRIMNGWWSNVYYEFVVHSGETLDFVFTQEMCDECKTMDLNFLSMENEITISKFYFDVDEDAPNMPASKTEYTYDAQGRVTCIAEYRELNGELVYTRKTEYTYDAKGRTTSHVEYRGQDGELVYTTKSEFAYDAYGQLILDATYYWENGAWVCQYKNEHIFDENGRETAYININPYWRSTKNEYIYDDNGTLTGYLTYELKDNQWILYSKTERTCGEDGSITGSLEYLWQDDEWVLAVKYDYTFNENGRQTASISYNWTDGAWVGSSKYEYAYDEIGRQTIYASYNWEDGAWVGTSKHEYAYNENGYETLSAYYNWEDGQWVGSSKYEYAYDEKGYQTLYAYFNWADGQWVGSSKYEYAYDANGNQTMYAYYVWEDGQWTIVFKSKNEYEYNNNGSVVSANYYDWVNDAWVNSAKDEYSYDEYNNQTKDIHYIWKNGEFELHETYVYHYIEFEPKVTASISPVVEEGTEITEQNAADISEFKMELNEVETFEVTENASAELLLDGVLAGTAGKENISEEDGVVTIKFKLLSDGVITRADFAAMLSAQTRAAGDDVKVEVRIAAGSFSINEEVMTEELAFSYTAPATVVEVIEEALSVKGIAADATAAPAYTLQGISANKDPKGLMIKNGQKLYVK